MGWLPNAKGKKLMQLVQLLPHCDGLLTFSFSERKKTFIQHKKI